MSSDPRTKPGQASARSKSAQVARCGAKVLVSCWKPPTAIRAMCSLRYRCPERADYNARVGRGEPVASGRALRARPRETDKHQEQPVGTARFRLRKAAATGHAQAVAVLQASGSLVR